MGINFDTAGKDAGAFSVTGCQFGSSNAYKVQDDLVIGFKFDKAQMKDSKFEIGEIKLGSTYTCGDMLLTAAVDGEFKGEFKAGALSTSLFQQVNKETAIAAELSYSSDNTFTSTFGASQTLSDTATVKTRLKSATSAPALDVAWIQKLGGKSSFTVAKSLTGAAPFSVAFTLDA